jgi:hypothetical protein
MKWVPYPQVDGTSFTKGGWNSLLEYKNGGARVSSSRSGYQSYTFGWLGSRDDLRFIKDLASGLYDNSDATDLIYFLDAQAADKNLLSPVWASPAVAASDGLTLFPGQVPSLVQTPANALDYPARSAVYTTNTASSSTFIPIPPGYTAWVGAHGSATGSAGILVTTTQGLTSGAQTKLTMLSVTDVTRVNASFDSTVCDGILISYTNGGSSSTDTLTVSGMMVQVLPSGTTPTQGGFISGQGHSGCQFVGAPQETPYMFDRIGITARLVETGAWL